MSTASKWQHKYKLAMGSILKKIKQERIEQGNVPDKDVYRGLEHVWYAVWTSVLAWLCEASPTLFIGPQTWVSNIIYDQDERTFNQLLVPDFILQRISERLPEDTQDEVQPQPEAQPQPRRSERVRQNNQSASQQALQPEDRGTSQHKQPGKLSSCPMDPWPEALLSLIHQIVALMEIKPHPCERSEDQVRKALHTARKQLKLQIQLLFSRQDWRDKDDKAVIGIYAAGAYWDWVKFDPSNVKPASMNFDPTYKPDADRPEEPGNDEDLGSVGLTRDDYELIKSNIDSPQVTTRSRKGKEPERNVKENKQPKKARKKNEPKTSGTAQGSSKTPGPSKAPGPSEAPSPSKEKSADDSKEAAECRDDAPEQPIRYFRLNTQESDEEFQHMLEAIFNLPGSELFGDIH